MGILDSSRPSGRFRLSAGGAASIFAIGACTLDPPSDESPAGGTSGSGGSDAGSSASGSGGSGVGGSGTGGASAGTTSGGAGDAAAGTTGGGGTGGTSVTGGTGGAAGSESGGSAGAAGSGGGVTGDRTTADGTCTRWNADRADMSEGTWSGSVDGCDPGDISPEGRANALRLINLYRWLADLPPVTTEPERDRQAQACSLIMQANGRLSHEIDMSWTCFSEVGAEGASSSNISGGPGVVSIDRYIIDSGNATTIGHRRWTLSNSLGPIGLGSTGTGASCFQNLQGTGRAGKAWVAWPAPGIIPLQAFGTGRTTLDDTGWTIQSDGIDLGDAVVTVTSGGMSLPVGVTELASGYGSRYAIRFNPDGWETTAGQTYAVSVTGTDEPISYEVTVVDCG